MNAVIPGAGVHHIAVRTHDYAKTLEFYRDLLGMGVKAEWSAPDGRQLALLDIGDGSCIEVIAFGADAPAAEPGQLHPFMHLALRTTDPDSVWQRVTAAGYESVIDPKDVTLGELSARLAFFSGPNGEVIEMFHERVSRT